MTVLETENTTQDTAPDAVPAAAPDTATDAVPDGRAAPGRPCPADDFPHPRPDGADRYTISEVAALTGLSAHTLRWYERIGLMPHIDRSHTGQRRFTNRDLDWLSLVGKLRLTGMPVADMVRYAELVRAGAHTYAERLELLVATRADVRRRVAELQETLAVLDFKIDIYAGARQGPQERQGTDR
ncbi:MULTISPECIES: MerR family transcriptional regulator [unclassified Streptomyces]|uniref:MerR family transcriptional regulator n=1 Tax=unclassified Streptomyces TaxID=2593676 RepID=UPI0022B6A1EF|nr:MULTISPECIES: MerR family transcriptional regulator [unclassified Streptomyces]MCZ7414069.1 MerR family transcriptional regulator [Streptomyces sp. WMMC897]MCZ7431064.1 MerR family transcriptional regulator [Streptomyces sp. WMMC1477]